MLILSAAKIKGKYAWFSVLMIEFHIFSAMLSKVEYFIEISKNITKYFLTDFKLKMHGLSMFYSSFATNNSCPS